ncbi:MAG: hypothetical protein ACRETB_13770 [Steroidobacteraceae bacterium]
MSGSVWWGFVRRDLYLARGLTAATVSIVLIACALLRFGGSERYVAMVLLIIALILQGVFVCIMSNRTERVQKSLAFSLAFPISPGEYAAAKAMSATALFLGPCVVAALAGLALLHTSSVAYGLLPISVATGLFLLDQFCLNFAITLCIESETWNSALVVWACTAISFFFYFVLRVSSVYTGLGGAVAVWSPALLGIVAGEAGFAVLIAVIVTAVLARRRDFL